MREVRMPKMGMTMEEGTIVSWLKQPGDPVTEGEAILEVMTDKTTLEVEAPQGGIIGPQLASVNEILAVGAVLCYILEEGEEPPEELPQKAAMPQAGPAVVAGPVAPARTETGAQERVRISPRARRLADELGLDLSLVTPAKGTRIVEADVRRVADGLGASDGIQPLHGIRRVVAERMAHSFQTVPHFYLTVETEATNLLQWQQQTGDEVQENGAPPTITDLLIKVAGQALKEHRQLNAAWHANGIQNHEDVNVGIATDTPEGLVVPVLKQADAKSVSTITRERQLLVEKARAGNLALADVEGGTFTITNLGMFGIDAFDAIVNAPQTAILAVGRIKERPVVVDGQVVARPTMIMTLSADHRVVDGAMAAGFISYLDELIRDPGYLQS